MNPAFVQQNIKEVNFLSCNQGKKEANRNLWTSRAFLFGGAKQAVGLLMKPRPRRLFVCEAECVSDSDSEAVYK